LYGKFTYCLFSQRDTSQARALLDQLVASYPQSIEREIAELQTSSFSRLAGSPSSSLMGGVAKGYHSATWNASEVASGVYFARFSATGRNGNVKLSTGSKLLLTK
jgi:hypothetical protein